MPIDLQEKSSGNIVVVRASGKITAEDYEHFLPEIERLIQQHGKLQMLFEMHDFHGWTLGGLWQDVKFDWKHFRDLERLAMVGDKAWEQAMATFCRPFTSAAIRYFDRSQLEDAEQWIGLTVAHASAETH